VPALTWPVIAAVLLGALLHAGWNALVKGGNDKPLDTALVHALAALIALPLALTVSPPAPAAWPFIAASLLVHVGYYTALVGAYQHGDLGLTYPIMRGLAPLLTALASAPLLAETPSAAAWLGIGGIAGGVLLVGLTRPAQALHHRRAVGYALANAVLIAAYTLIDGRGIRVQMADGATVWPYVLWLFALDGVAYPLSVAWGRARRDGPALRATLRARWPVAACGACASLGSYAIALWAMGRAPVASVAALREVSVLFAALLGHRLLREWLTTQRALGTVVLVAGVIALRLG